MATKKHKHFMSIDSMSKRCKKCGAWRKVELKCTDKDCSYKTSEYKLCKCDINAFR